MKAEDDLGRGLKSVEIFGTILGSMTGLGERPGLVEIAAASGLQPAQLRPYLTSLQRLGLLELDADAKGHAIGPLAARLGQCRLEMIGQSYGVLPLAQRIAAERDLLVALVFWAGQMPTVAKVIPSRSSLNLNLRPGTVYNVTGTATGRVFLALSDDPRVAERAEDEFEARTDVPGIGDVPERATLEAMISEIHETGYSFVQDAYFPGINGLAVPVFDEGERLLCVMTIVGSTSGLPRRSVADLAEEISRDLRAARDEPAVFAELPAGIMEPAEEAASVPEDRRGVGSAEIAGRLLSAMARSPEPRKLKDVCSDAALVPAKAHGYLVSLRRTGLVEKVPGSPRYRLGPVAAELLLVRLHSYDAFESARKLIGELSGETGMMCFLSVWGTYGPVVVDIVRGREARHTDIHIGRSMPLARSATGLLFRAHISAELRGPAVLAERAAFPRLHDANPEDDLLDAQAREIRAAGCATWEQRGPIRLRSLAAPIFDHNGEIWFAVTMTGELERVLADETHLRQQLLAAVARISADLGHAP